MSKRSLILLVIFILAIAGGWYVYREYDRKNISLSTQAADYSMDMSALMNEYDQHDSSANMRYLGKVIEVKGPVKKVERDDRGFVTISLGDSTSMNSVICSMDSSFNQASQAITGKTMAVKGIYTGYNKDPLLGSDIILNRCVANQ